MIASAMNAADIVNRGQDIYDARLRDALESENRGRYVVINVETGDYALGDDMLELADSLHAQQPNAPLYSLRIGYPYTDRLSGRVGTERP